MCAEGEMERVQGEELSVMVTKISTMDKTVGEIILE